MTEVDPLKALKEYVAKFDTQYKAAAKLGVSTPYLNDMLKGNRRVSRTVLEALGIRSVFVLKRAS